MFLKQHFYHQHIRKAIIAFGTIFNQITVERRNSAGEIAQSIRVPPKTLVMQQQRNKTNWRTVLLSDFIIYIDKFIEICNVT